MAKTIKAKEVLTVEAFLGKDRVAKRLTWLGDLVSFVQFKAGDVLRIASKNSDSKEIPAGSLEVRTVESDTLKVQTGEKAGSKASWEEIFMELTRGEVTYRVWVPWGQLTSSVLVRDGFSTDDVRDIRHAADGRYRHGMVNAVYDSEFEVNDGTTIVDAFRNGCTVDKVYTSSTSKKRGYRWVKPAKK